MKTMKRFAYVGAIALLSVLGFSACSSSDDATTDGGLTPQTTGEPVKTQFSISLPSQIGGMRMTASTVQDAGTVASFRGMSDIVLIPYLHATDRTNRLGANITLAAGSIIQPASGSSNQANSIPAGSLLANSTAVLYNDVTIPVGTSGFLFYGKATGTDGYDNGALTAAGLTGEASGISFTPVQIQATPVTTKGDALAAYVTSIAQAKDATDATITWAGCADEANKLEAWYSVGLGQLYTNFTSMKAGGSAYVQAAVQDLYNSVKDNTDAVSVAIKTAITKDTYVSSVDATTGVLTFKDVISGYPGNNNGMPDGAAALSWSESTPKTATAVTSVTPTNSFYVQDMTKIVYPASLYYYVNSGVKTSVASQKDAYNGDDNWTTILGKYTTGTSVTSTTRSVAIFKPIQYAVGRLDVKVNKLNETTYYDRRGDVITPTGGYTLTGVLIGGQKEVDYKFEQKSGSGVTEYAIYDNVINTEDANAVVTKTQDAGHNYTLALETAAEQDVYVVLEFVNNGDDFMGIDGVVKKGCKFYMVGTLVPDADVTDKVSDVANTGKKVFKQDYTTIAKFTFGAGTADTTGPGGTGGPDGVSDTPGGFANAYTTIPDLRTPELELGFSVDLEWKAGITFDVTF